MTLAAGSPPYSATHMNANIDHLGTAPNIEHPRELDLFDSHDA